MARLAESANEASVRLRAGDLVSLPTETVYGLGADATNNEAVQRLRATKDRPDTTPLPVCVSSTEAAQAFAVWNDQARRLAEAYWPGPVSIVLPAREGTLAPDVAPGMDAVALRCPDHPLTLSVLAMVGRPLVLPSANPSGTLAPTTADAVLQAFPDHDLLVLDGGPTAAGIESTILRCTGEAPEILRLGALDPASIARTLGIPEEAIIRKTNPDSSRNATRAPVAIAGPTIPDAGDILITHRPEATTPPGVERVLLPEDAPGYAKALYAALRDADQKDPARIIIDPVPADPAWDTVRDRIQRAAGRTDPGA